MKRIVLIETKAPNYHVFSDVHIPRLGSIQLGSILHELGYHVDVYIEDIAPLDFDIVKNADLVGISALSSTAPYSYALADRIRAMGIPVIMGGTHVTFLAEEALEHADFILRGEADESIVDFMQAFSGDGDYEKIPGLSYWKEGKIQHNLDCPLPHDLNKNPIPDFRLARGVPNMSVVCVCTSRGCPCDCSFCSVTAFNGRKYRAMSVERVLKEVEFHYTHNSRAPLLVLRR